MSRMKRIGVVAAVLGLAAIGVGAAPSPAKAWWRGGVSFGVVLPPVVVAPPVYAPPPVVYSPPVVYAAPPVVYAAPPRPVWVPGHWQGGYWVPAHWA